VGRSGAKSVTWNYTRIEKKSQGFWQIEWPISGPFSDIESMSSSLQPTQIVQTHSEQTRLATTATYYAAYVSLGLTTASLGPLLPLLADQTHTLLNQVSILFTARWLGYLIGSLVIGRVYDRRSGHG
jgi:hypothetical protein